MRRTGCSYASQCLSQHMFTIVCELNFFPFVVSVFVPLPNKSERVSGCSDLFTSFFLLSATCCANSILIYLVAVFTAMPATPRFYLSFFFLYFVFTAQCVFAE